jgi:hypothetical protein
LGARGRQRRRTSCSSAAGTIAASTKAATASTRTAGSTTAGENRSRRRRPYRTLQPDELLERTRHLAIDAFVSIEREAAGRLVEKALRSSA